MKDLLMGSQPQPLGDEDLIIDYSHCGDRYVTGLERITLELFSADNLAPLRAKMMSARSTRAMIFTQSIALPLEAARNRRALILTPGFPPGFFLTLFADRLIPYIHDMFLLTRRNDLSAKAKIYMAPPFSFAVKRLPRFMVNSQTTAAELRKFCRADADVRLFRPVIHNVFGVSDGLRAAMETSPGRLRLVAMGTVEPRKNLQAAARIVAHLRQSDFPDATLEVIGRHGWGADYENLSGQTGVILHGYKDRDEAKAIIDQADFFITTSHDEGLGLTPLEAQYAGLGVIAPDKPVFRETLGASALFIDAENPAASANSIKTTLAQPDWRRQASASASANLARWNALAEGDRHAIIQWFDKLLRQSGDIGG